MFLIFDPFFFLSCLSSHTPAAFRNLRLKRDFFFVFRHESNLIPLPLRSLKKLKGVVVWDDSKIMITLAVLRDSCDLGRT